MSALIRNAGLHDARNGAELVDVRIEDGRISEIGTDLPGEELFDAHGATLMPGLVDHHLHLHAMAAAADRSVNLAGLTHAQSTAALVDAFVKTAGNSRAWIRAVGVDEDIDGLGVTALFPHGPVRVQHSSGAFWAVNSRGAEEIGLAAADHPGIERDGQGRPTGRIWRADDWLRSRLPGQGAPDLAGIGRQLASHGITAVTDATPDIESFDASALPQHVTLLGVGLEATPPSGVAVGPFKIVLADSGFPDFDDLTARIRAAHGTGRAVAVHCVTREALALLIAALDVTGTVPGDRIEHGAIIPREVIPVLRARGLRVVTQPGFIVERGDRYLRDVPVGDQPDLYRCASLLAAGVPVGLSSDAPYGPLSPWRGIAAATSRRTRNGRGLGPVERIGPNQALASYLSPPDDPGGPPRRIEVGSSADLVVRFESDDHREILATIIAGQVV